MEIPRYTIQEGRPLEDWMAMSTPDPIAPNPLRRVAPLAFGVAALTIFSNVDTASANSLFSPTIQGKNGVDTRVVAGAVVGTITGAVEWFQDRTNKAQIIGSAILGAFLGYSVADTVKDFPEIKRHLIEELVDRLGIPVSITSLDLILRNLRSAAPSISASELKKKLDESRENAEKVQIQGFLSDFQDTGDQGKRDEINKKLAVFGYKAQVEKGKVVVYQIEQKPKNNTQKTK